MTQVTQELVDELVSFVRAFVHEDTPPRKGRTWMQCARDILAKLPPPLDPDIEEARKMIVESYDCIDSAFGDGPARVRAIRDGEGKDFWEMQAVLAAIKLGRSLERGA